MAMVVYPLEGMFLLTAAENRKRIWIVNNSIATINFEAIEK